MTRLHEAYWPASTEIPVRETTVGDLLRDAALDSPDRLALVAGSPGDDRRWTFSELLAEAEVVAGALLSRFAPGERIAVWAPNIPEWVLLEYGAALAGITLVTANPAYQAKELAYVLGQSGSAGVFLISEYRGNPMLKAVASVRADLPQLREVVLFDDWHEFCTPGDVRTLPDVAPDDPAQIQYTSGTTGFPKGALLHHRGLTNNAAAFALWQSLEPGDVYINPMPLFHTAGCVLGVLGALIARAVHIPVLAFDPDFVLALIERERGTVLVGVPTMLIAILESERLGDRELGHLRTVVSGGTPVPAELVKRVENTLGVNFSIVYGTTECSPLIAQTRHDDAPNDKATTVGRAVPQVEIKIVDPLTGSTVAPGAIGELCCRGYNVMSGYYAMSEETADAIDAGGWYHTGDLATMDPRGYCRIEGRLKDMIIRGGENIYPREIENVLFTHPAVAEVAVVGVPDDRWGEQIAAFVRLADGALTDPEKLAGFVRQQLAPFKTPSHWVFVDSFPLTASGKIQKYVLRDKFVAGELMADQPPTW